MNISIMQVQGFEEARQRFGRVTKYNGLLDCFIKVVREEGVMAFYKGTSPTILKVTVKCACACACTCVSDYLMQ